ncbi:hypothetical protein PAXRUDRAFT_822979 [Paxillus rubicundulus Ve08.2h10]|uniref:Uncharacterized protein n=1 Tax=Paxillus rubicundulus Ve08.2h10 TaxID=930991 RepID=A0A0D0DKY5_9AGAM|nr:hypothetical protein PAXRUDRAFT_822979 [Paxillus rubicundulus Ve08.2h10]
MNPITHRVDCLRASRRDATLSEYPHVINLTARSCGLRINPFPADQFPFIVDHVNT